MKMVFAMDRARCRIPGESGHGDHHGFLNAAGPCEIPIEYGCEHDAQQIEQIAFTLNLKRMACLHDLSQSTMGFDFFSRKDELVVNIEQYKQAADDEPPLREQTQGKLKRHAPQEAEKKRRITEGRQQACGVAHNKYEEDDEMSPMPPQMVRAQERPNQQHRGPGGSDQVRKKRPDCKKDCVDQRCSSELPLDVNPAGDHE